MGDFVLAGDIGGTKVNLATYRVEGPGRLTPGAGASFRSREHDGLEAIVRAFLRDHREGIRAAAFGVAGPVLDGRVKVTNLPWSVEAESLAEAVGCGAVRLMNDLETTAYGALFLGSDELEVLNEGVPRRAHRVVIAAGTGLGQAILFWDGERYRPSATEGGHAGFAPRNEREIGLLRFLLDRYERVSWERVVSGPGLLAIFEYLHQGLELPVAPEILARVRKGDPSAEIGEAGVRGACPTCEAAVDLFVSLYGAQAANLTLGTLALGGVYVGGGIVTKLLPKVRAGGFMQAFRDAGRFAPLLSDVPVRVILDPKASLLGAAHAAAEAVGG